MLIVDNVFNRHCKTCDIVSDCQLYYDIGQWRDCGTFEKCQPISKKGILQASDNFISIYYFVNLCTDNEMRW